MGRYADLYLNALEELRPKEYARRRGSPELRRETQAIEERAMAQESEIVRQLLLLHPEPADYPSRVQHLQTLHAQAREQAFADLLPEPENPEASAPSPNGQAATTS